MIFGKEILEDPIIFIEEVISVIDNESDKNNWRTYLQIAIGLNQLLTNNVTLYSRYNTSKKTVDKFFTDFEGNPYFTKISLPAAFQPYDDITKRRTFTYLTQAPVNQDDVNRLLAIYSDKSSTDKTFNLKKAFIS
jgi:hypothetical protein